MVANEHSRGRLGRPAAGTSVEGMVYRVADRIRQVGTRGVSPTV